MKIEIGSDIGEPLAVLCHTSSKIWSRMVKIHLQNPNPDAISLLKGTRIFVIPLDEDTPTIAKISKSYNTIAPSSHTSLKIEGEQLKTCEAHHLFKSIVTNSFKRRQNFEITKVTKRIGDYFAWCGTTSPEQLKKILKHTITIGSEVLKPVAQTLEGLTEEEIAKRNCLVLIAMNLNQTKSTTATEEAIRRHIGTELVTAIYFARVQGTTHTSVANIQCESAMVYKSHARKTDRILGKYVTFYPHPKSLDGALKPNEKTLKKFGFMDVNATLANTIEAVKKAPQNSKIESDIATLVANEVSKKTKGLKEEILKDAQEYTNKTTEALRDSLSQLEKALEGSMAAIKNMSRPSLTNSSGRQSN